MARNCRQLPRTSLLIFLRAQTVINASEYVKYAFSPIVEHTVNLVEHQASWRKGVNMQCSNCGAEVPADATFCGSCGAKQGAVGVPVAVSPASCPSQVATYVPPTNTSSQNVAPALQQIPVSAPAPQQIPVAAPAPAPAPAPQQAPQVEYSSSGTPALQGAPAYSQQAVPFQGTPAAPSFQSIPQTPPVGNARYGGMPMSWFKFIIYFQLFCSALTYGAAGLSSITGRMYASEGFSTLEIDMLYSLYPSLKAADVVSGVLFLAIAVLCLLVRKQLADLAVNAPRNYIVLVVGAPAVSVLIGFIRVCAAPDAIVPVPYPLVSLIACGIYAAIMCTYFKKRKHLFVN